MAELIFVVDNRNEVCRWVGECLEAAGYKVRTVLPGDVLSEAKIEPPSLIIIITSNSPPGSNFELCRRLHNGYHAARPALVYFMESNIEEERILALESGADDCIAQPISPRELVARIRTVLRRSPTQTGPQYADTADLVIDSGAMKVSVRGSEVPTTTLEFQLIEYLARHRGQVFTRDVLLDAVWGDMQFITPRSVDACIRRIRQKIEPDRKKPILLKTIRGVGYRLDAATVWRSTGDEICDCPACRRKPGSVRFSTGSTGRRRPSA